MNKVFKTACILSLAAALTMVIFGVDYSIGISFILAYFGMALALSIR